MDVLNESLYNDFNTRFDRTHGGRGSIRPLGKFHKGKTHQKRLFSGNDLHKKMT